MDEVRDFIKEKGIEVLSIHAAQGNLIADSYKQLAEPAMWIADQLGARCVTFHPNQRKANCLAGQETAIKHLNEIQQGKRRLPVWKHSVGNGACFTRKKL